MIEWVTDILASAMSGCALNQWAEKPLIATALGYVQLTIDNFEFFLDLEQTRWLADNLWKAAYLMADVLRDYDLELMS